MRIIDNPMTLLAPIGSKVVPFCGSYLESYKVIPKKELLWSLRATTASKQQGTHETLPKKAIDGYLKA